MSPLDPDGETAKPSLSYVCVWGLFSYSLGLSMKVGESITMVHLRVLLQDLDEKHSE